MKIKNNFPFNGNIGLLILRIFIGFRILYGVIDNIFNWEKMIEFSVFLNNFEFPIPIGSAVLSVGIQFISAMAIILGVRIRFFSFLLVLNFIIALLFVHIPLNDTVEGMTPALAMLFTSLAFIFTGAGHFSLDYYFSTNRKKDKMPTMV